MEMNNREKIYIWLYSFKSFHQLKKYGLIHYSSRKMNYVMMYIDSDKKEEIMEELSNLSFVREVSLSPHKEVDQSFEHSLEEWIQTLPDTGETSSSQIDFIV